MTQESYPGVHVVPAAYRGPLLDLGAMDWQQISGKIQDIYDKTISGRDEHPGGLWVSWVKMLPGSVFPEHRHVYPQLFVFTGGEGIAKLDGESIRVRAGSVVRCFKGELHELVNDGEQDLMLYQISLPLWRAPKAGEG